jgi:hypothetical protein
MTYYEAMLDLNHRANHYAAALGFKNCYKLSLHLTKTINFIGPEISSIIELACFHASLAYVYCGNIREAKYYFNQLLQSDVHIVLEEQIDFLKNKLKDF